MLLPDRMLVKYWSIIISPPPPPTPYNNLSGITDTWLICIPIEKAQNNEPCQDREHVFAQNSGNRRSGEKITKLLCGQV